MFVWLWLLTRIMVSHKMVLLHHTGLWVTSIGFDITSDFTGGGRGNWKRKLQLTFLFPFQPSVPVHICLQPLPRMITSLKGLQLKHFYTPQVYCTYITLITI